MMVASRAGQARPEPAHGRWSLQITPFGAAHLPHRFWVAAHDRGDGPDVAGGIKVLPGGREPGAARELREEGPLRRPLPSRNGCRALTSPR
jgi:hypothetical protein